MPSTSGTPLSWSVGRSGLSGERFAVVIASMRTRPLRTWGVAEDTASTPAGRSPPASEAAAGAPPL